MSSTTHSREVFATRKEHAYPKLIDTANAWRGGSLPLSRLPGSRDRYEEVGNEIIDEAWDDLGLVGYTELTQGAQSGVSLIMRYLHAIALDSHNYERNVENVHDVAKHQNSFVALAGFAAISGPANRDLEWRFKLRQASPSGTVAAIDTSQGYVVIPGFQEAKQEVISSKTVKNEVASHPDAHPACDALKVGFLKPIYIALAGVAFRDPTLFTATLQNGV